MLGLISNDSRSLYSPAYHRPPIPLIWPGRFLRRSGTALILDPANPGGTPQGLLPLSQWNPNLKESTAIIFSSLVTHLSLFLFLLLFEFSLVFPRFSSKVTSSRGSQGRSTFQLMQQFTQGVYCPVRYLDLTMPFNVACFQYTTSYDTVVSR
ncbi:hypothetical protein F4809DRAFT_182910 [Biscogniauxia mediterranea]|nr:hypothetical protein F4809DRAFT_182910 [Biscogniauxia mediterranea]